MYLIDTMVFSELFKRRRYPGFLLAEQPLRTCTLSFGDNDRRDRAGIEAQKRRDPPFAGMLLAWLDRSLAVYADRILPVDAKVARRWGQLAQGSAIVVRICRSRQRPSSTG